MAWVQGAQAWAVVNAVITVCFRKRLETSWSAERLAASQEALYTMKFRTGSENPFIGPEPACGISNGAAKKAVRDWTNRKHKKHWESPTGLKQAKGFISGPSARRTKDLLELNRDQLSWVVGLLTGHCLLKGHLFKLGLTDDPTCERCLQEDQSATHILCDCEAIACLRFRHLGQFFMEPSDFYDAPIFKVLHFIRSVGLIRS
jgi:hypothetical protein